MPSNADIPKSGDEVRFVGSHLGGVVSGITSDGAMVCMPIGHRYQLRGPVPLDVLEVITPSTTNVTGGDRG